MHRTGCSLFCGVDAEANQLMLKRVLLAYARWNKAIGYCQGFNMLAAIILEVMEKSEPDALKVFIGIYIRILLIKLIINCMYIMLLAIFSGNDIYDRRYSTRRLF